MGQCDIDLVGHKTKMKKEPKKEEGAKREHIADTYS